MHLRKTTESTEIILDFKNTMFLNISLWPLNFLSKIVNLSFENKRMHREKLSFFLSLSIYFSMCSVVNCIIWVNSEIEK